MKKELQEIYDALMKYKDVSGINLNEAVREVSAQIATLDIEEKLGVKIRDKYAMLDGFLVLNEFMDLLHLDRDVEADPEDDDEQSLAAGWYLRMRLINGPYILHKNYPKNMFDKFFDHLKTEYKADYSDAASKRLCYNIETNNSNVRRLLRDFDGILQKYRESVVDEIRNKAITEKEEELRILKGERGRKTK